VFEVYKMPTIKIDDCVACGACADVCPQDAITVDDFAVIDGSKCVDCGACVDECPSSAIEE
jgi:NAD-dependent dihydropyrimidine dehydrogenase PreA subunit